MKDGTYQVWVQHRRFLVEVDGGMAYLPGCAPARVESYDELRTLTHSLMRDDV
jgi:hypothetical protein